jgi:hypothetical protein
MGSAKTARSLDTFRAAYDKGVIVPNKIRAALEKLEKDEGPTAWRHDNEIRELAGISTTELAEFRDRFQDNIVVTAGGKGKNVWFATVKAAKEAAKIPGMKSMKEV